MPLFPELPPPAADGRRLGCKAQRNGAARTTTVGLGSPTYKPAYVPRCAPMRTAQYFSRELVRAKDRRRKTECYLNMIAAVLAKDGAS